MVLHLAGLLGRQYLDQTASRKEHDELKDRGDYILRFGFMPMNVLLGQLIVLLTYLGRYFRSEQAR